uniref:Reverse transcriptase domain-containing protein n=1 Tax=Caenorhabditis japonica TaxID=281687 RepID=A0A8R1EBU2_CAEJA
MWEKCNEFKIPLVAFFLDLACAFDNVNWTKITEVLNNLQIGRNVILALNNSNSLPFGDLNVLNKKMKFKIKRGVCQGDSSSPPGVGPKRSYRNEILGDQHVHPVVLRKYGPMTSLDRLNLQPMRP